MSTFSGKIEEIPDISVDRFENLKSDTYFLSHCHSDHMVGLHSSLFQEELIKNNKFIYTSEVSYKILLNMASRIKNNIKVLCLNVPTTVSLRNKNISVISMPAGHCPGSVMFLFESNDKCILYTGDYRINKNDLIKFKPFYNSFNEIKVIDAVYLDTTFFLKSYLKFPQRDQSLNEICKIIKEWIDKGKNYHINLHTSAKYGYEYVFIKIYENLGTPVHVSAETFNLYSIIPEFDKCVTIDGSLTQIHSNCGATFRSTCDSVSNCNKSTIKISAMRWRQDDLKTGMSYVKNGVHFVCYSTHASYEEGVALIKFLKPRKIEPCVLQSNPHENKEMTQLIMENLDYLKKEIEINKPKLFEVENKDAEKIRETNELYDDFGIMDSPPRRKSSLAEDTVKSDANNLLNILDSPPRKKLK